MNERALRYVHNEYDRLTNKMTLACRRCQDMLIIVLKALTNRWPAYFKSLFKLRDNVKNLRGVNKLVLPKVKTTQYGLKSTVYTASKAWNSLSDELRLMTNIKLFTRSAKNFIFWIALSFNYICIYYLFLSRHISMYFARGLNSLNQIRG